MRQVGLTVILAQVGCMVPACFARIGITDRIFTRVGAVDDLSQGQSTFQVEMAETAAILSQTTDQSLVLLDEIGRGTAVADGIAIAWSVAEHMAGARYGAGNLEFDPAKATVPRTIFVTHYHELNVLASLPSVEAFRMEVVPANLDLGSGFGDGEWVYTHRILPGASWDSHGLTIARRAGFPRSVIERATEVLNILRAPSSKLSSHLRKSLSPSQNMSDSENMSDSDSAVQARIVGDDRGDEINHVSNFHKASDDASSPFYDTGFEAGRKAGLLEAQSKLEALISGLLS